MNSNEKFSLQLICSQKDRAQFTGKDFFIASAEPGELSARFLIEPTTVVAGSDEKSGERTSK